MLGGGGGVTFSESRRSAREYDFHERSVLPYSMPPWQARPKVDSITVMD